MKRIHLFEFEDLSWCPKPIREITTDFLLGLYNVLHIYEPAYSKIIETLNKSNTNAIVDCCSGSGGPNLQLRDYLDKNGKGEVTITLTDKYPNTDLFNKLAASHPNKIFACKTSEDAANLSSGLHGMRTFFSSFHHFSPNQAIQIIQNAVDNGEPIGIFECTQRHPLDFIRTLISPLMMLFILPFSKRLTWQKFTLTYLFPVTLFTNMWDYFVSNLRTYSPDELKHLVSKVHAPKYQWEINKIWSNQAKCHITYLIGYKV